MSATATAARVDAEGSTAAVSCQACGATAAAPPVTWSSAVTRRGGLWMCEACTRQHLRSIECRLDEDWS